MGANEKGVVIGNEAVHAKSPPPTTDALTGMDLIRLALERASSAAEALEVIAGLLRDHGQGGNCGHLKPSHYNNSFLIADSAEAFVLETVARDWVAESISDLCAISNRYSIAASPLRQSDGLDALMQNFGWDGASPPDVGEIIRDPQREHISNAKARAQRAETLLRDRAGRLTAADFMRVLRDHDPATPDAPQICMHAHHETLPSQTTGSLVSSLSPTHSVHWVTATAAPCISIFKPVLFGASVPTGPTPDDAYDEETLWWDHERIHRTLDQGDGLDRFVAEISPERDALEAKFAQRVEGALRQGDPADQTQVVAECWREAARFEKLLQHQLACFSQTARADNDEWKRLNAIARFPGSTL
jgi:dipeptidase